METMTEEEVAEVRRHAEQLAADKHLEIEAVGDGLYRLEGYDELLAGWQIVKLLNVPARKERSDKGKRRPRSGEPTRVRHG